MAEYYDHFSDYNFYDMIPTSSGTFQILSLVRSVASTDMSVLIVGEAGTRKRTLAKIIHANSKRKYGRFIIIDCRVAQNSLELELLGSEHGIFTGTMQRIGKLEQASGGTVFLEEIDEMPSLLQARLLRVLQDREIQRAGGTTTMPIDIRIITSITGDPEVAVEEGKLRKDIFYRIDAFRIVIPPLRQCREDIRFLANHFLKLSADENGKSIRSISSEALELLMNYNWPGNIQELENVIEHAVMMETSDILQATSLPMVVHCGLKGLRKFVSQDKFSTADDILPLEEIKKQAIIHAMEATGNNVQQTARALGINRTTVYRKLEKYNLLELAEVRA